VDGQTEAVIFCGLQELQVSKTLLCVTSHSVNVLINIQTTVLSHQLSSVPPSPHMLFAT
jgi:hypothetical protein